MSPLHSFARLLVVVLAAALAALALAAVPAGAARSHHGHHVKRAHRVHRCATVRHRRRHRQSHRHRRRHAARAICARVTEAAVPTLVAPTPDASVSVDSRLRGKATVPVPVNHVTFRVDGRIVKRDYTTPYAFDRLASRIGTGDHDVQAIAVTGGIRYPSRVVRVKIKSSGGQGDSSWASGKTWASSFETGDFTEWSWWGQDQQDLWGHISVVDPAQVGIPPLGGSRVARFETTADDIANGRTNAKLYRGFGTGLGSADSRPPSDVSGVYSSWYYVPNTYTVPDHTSVNVFQFKEQYRTSSGPVSDPLWWVQLGPVHWADSMSQAYGEGAVTGRADAPVAFINYWGNDWKEKRHFVPLPLDRWFQIQAVVRQNDRIDFYIDGQLLDTARASTYPVSPFHGADSMAWTFGIGNYSTGVNGPLYADRASYTAG